MGWFAPWFSTIMSCMWRHRWSYYSITTGKKYLSEIAGHLKRAPQTVDFHLKILENAGLVSSSSEEGKVFYQLRDRSVLKFLRERRPIPALHHPKPPHEIVEDAMNEILKKLNEIEKRLENIEKKLTQ